MIIKKFLAKSEKDAIEMAKNELGNNAIVMNIKKVKPKGLVRSEGTIIWSKGQKFTQFGN